MNIQKLCSKIAVTLSLAFIMSVGSVGFAFGTQEHSVELFWWGGRIGQPWGGNVFNDSDGNSVPVLFPLQGAMEPPQVSSWEDTEIFMGWRQVLFRTPDGRLFELRSPAGSGDPANQVTQVTLPPAWGVASWNDVTLMAGDRHVFALIPSTGALFAWGGNQQGQLGIGVMGADVDTPTPVPIGAIAAADSSVQSWNDVDFTISFNHTLVRTPQGHLFGWGQNSAGQLALGGALPSANVPTPTAIPLRANMQAQGVGATTWNDVELFGAANYTLALVRPSGALFGWGTNTMGQLGQGTTTNGSSLPVRINPPAAAGQIPGLTDWRDVEIHVHPGASRTFARHSPTGNLFVWGQNDAGQAGVGTTEHVLSPRHVPLPATMSALPNIDSWNDVELITGAGHTFARTAAGELFVWGNNASGQLGIGADIPGNRSSAVLKPVPQVMQDAGVETWNDVVFTPGFVTNFALMRTPSVPLTKTLEMPEGTTVPDASFGFRFIPRQIQLTDNPPTMSRPVSDIPTISDQRLYLDMPTVETAGGVTTVTGSLNLRSLVNSDNFFPGSGVFVWEVYEIEGSSTTVAPSTMTYDLSRFQMRAYVSRDGAVILNIYELVRDGSNLALGDKLHYGIHFTNQYRTTAGTATINALEIRKNVVGMYANLTTPFTFTLNLSEHALAPLSFPISAYRIGTNNVPVAVSIPSSPHGLTLAHGERFVIPEIYAGTTWSVTEAAHLDFTAGVSVVVGGSVVHTETNPDPDMSLSSGNRLIADSGRNAADFTNTHEWITPSGLSIANAPFIAVGLAALLLAMLTVSRRRRLIEEMPMPTSFSLDR